MARSSDGSRGSCSVVLYARDTIHCEALAERFADWPHVRVVGYGTTTDRALELVDREAPDVVLGHADGPFEETLRLARGLRAGGRPVDLILFGVEDDVPTVVQYLEAGAATCVLESDGLDRLDRAIRGVMDGRAELDPRVAYQVARRLAVLSEICDRNGLDVTRLRSLTDREREVLQLLGRRLSNREIANRLYVEVSTVKSHVHSILEKLQVAGRKEAARYLLLSEEDPET